MKYLKKYQNTFMDSKILQICKSMHESVIKSCKINDPIIYDNSIKNNVLLEDADIILLFLTKNNSYLELMQIKAKLKKNSLLLASWENLNANKINFNIMHCDIIRNITNMGWKNPVFTLHRINTTKKSYPIIFFHSIAT
jgi:hypothetical protein